MLHELGEGCKRRMETIGKYQILDTIGSGGFAVVYKGYDPDIKRVVAIKVCALHDDEARARFYHEAEIAGSLSHKNITTIYEFGLFQQTPFLVEEYLPGADLARLIRRGEPEVLEEKLDILLQIADGLAHAHRQGVIHRDIKPANVRVLDNGRAKILDFGTAKIAGTESGLTRSGMTLGTVAYLAPERLRAQPARTQSDVFSFGALAFEVMAFERPFPGQNIPAVIEEVLASAPAPPVAERCADCPPELAAVIDRCLAKDEEARYTSGTEVLAELEAFREGWLNRPAPAPEPSTAAIAPSLVARIEKLFGDGREARARMLLEEALEIAPRDTALRRLAQAHGLAPEREPSATINDPSPSPDEEARRQAEAGRSIRTLIDDGRLVEAARALSFARRLFTDLAPTQELRRAMVERLRQSIVDLRHAALRQSHHVAVTLRGLDADKRLDLDLAEHLAERAEELAPERTSAREIAASLRQRQTHAGGPSSRTHEAVASIERLLAAGDIDTAASALRFALDRYGAFAEADALARRIDHARRSG